MHCSARVHPYLACVFAAFVFLCFAGHAYAFLSKFNTLDWLSEDTLLCFYLQTHQLAARTVVYFALSAFLRVLISGISIQTDDFNQLLLNFFSSLGNLPNNFQ